MIIVRVIHQLIEELNTLKGCYRMLVNEGIEDEELKQSIFGLERTIAMLKDHPKTKSEIEGLA